MRWGVYSSAEMESVYSKAPADWAGRIVGFIPFPRVKCKQSHPGFELELLCPFPYTLGSASLKIYRLTRKSFLSFFLFSFFLSK